jgi:hypothetical protein
MRTVSEDGAIAELQWLRVILESTPFDPSLSHSNSVHPVVPYFLRSILILSHVSVQTRC